jgi:hypothetical protein
VQIVKASIDHGKTSPERNGPGIKSADQLMGQIALGNVHSTSMSKMELSGGRSSKGNTVLLAMLLIMDQEAVKKA